MYSLILVATVLACVSGKPCESQESENAALILSLNQKLLRAAEEPETQANPSVHLALRLSDHHNLAKEAVYLNSLRNDLHDRIKTSLVGGKPVSGLLALYALALKSSCHDLNTVHFTVNHKTETLLTHLKRQMEQEKDHIIISHRPLTNYYQYSLGVLALCVSGVRVNSQVTHKLIKAEENGHMRHGDVESIDTLAMAGMALQCVDDASCYVHGGAHELTTALASIKQKLLDSRRDDGHMGNEFSTGLAVQALLAMGTPVEECSASMEAMRKDAREETYHNPMAISQTLPALQRKTYLQVKNKECSNEDDSLVLAPKTPDVDLSSQVKVTLHVRVVKANGDVSPHSVDVPKTSSLLHALELLQEKNDGFTFEKEPSLWGPYLSVVNGEQARLSDRRYWHLSSNGTSLTEGMRDYKINAAQTITIKNKGY